MVALQSHSSESLASSLSLLDQRVQFGKCRLAIDPLASDEFPLPTLCIGASASSEVVLRVADSHENLGMNFLNGYIGIHLTPWLSLHGEGRRERMFYLSDREQRHPKDDAITDSMFIQLGNQAMHRFRLSIGKMDMPFGINHAVAPQIQRAAYKNENYWRYPHYVARLTFENLINRRLEIAYGQNFDPINAPNTNKLGPAVLAKRHALAARFSIDISALDGTRIMVFGYGDDRGKRRFGAGIINRTTRGELTSFEWVRHRETPDGRSHPLQQIFRLAYEGVYVADSRFISEFESDHDNYRLLTLGQDLRFFEQGAIRLAMSYHFSEDDSNKPSFWFVTAGVQLSL